MLVIMGDGTRAYLSKHAMNRFHERANRWRKVAILEDAANTVSMTTRQLMKLQPSICIQLGFDYYYNKDTGSLWPVDRNNRTITTYLKV